MNEAEQSYYVQLIRESSQALEPLPVCLTPEWETLLPQKNKPVLEGIRAVLFDLYGTLFVSAAGEITAAHDSNHTNSAKLRGEKTSKEIPETMKDYFLHAVQSRHEKARAAGIRCPEVRAEEIWAAYEGTIPAAWEPGKSAIVGNAGVSGVDGCELALRYELANNPVYPMPHAETALRSLAAKGYTMGIISNAQFYSPLLFNAFFNASPAGMGFDPDLLIYSFEEREAKPSPRLFTIARERLNLQGIKPEETLYVGNDMRNDIVPAAEAGFKTALFAGDRRSLRLREDDPGCSGKKPTVIINDLRALEKTGT